MKSRLMLSIFALSVASTPALCHEKPLQDCKVTFSVVYLDRLNNINKGIPAKSVKDVEKKLSKYGDVCYAGDKKADLVFFIHTTPALYHGTRVYTDNSTSTAAVTDANGTQRQPPHPVLRLPLYPTLWIIRCSSSTSKANSRMALTEYCEL
jgi:hypothetical protein